MPKQPRRVARFCIPINEKFPLLEQWNIRAMRLIAYGAQRQLYKDVEWTHVVACAPHIGMTDAETHSLVNMISSKYLTWEYFESPVVHHKVRRSITFKITEEGLELGRKLLKRMHVMVRWGEKRQSPFQTLRPWVLKEDDEA